MHRSLPFLVAALPIWLAAPAFALDGNYYVRAWGGASDLQGDSLTFGSTTGAQSYDTGVSFGAAVGYDYGDSPFRAEIEFNYRSGDAIDIPLAFGSTGDFASTSLMVNGIYVFDTASDWKPYVGLGLGVLTEVDFDIGQTEFSNRGGVAYQAMVGVEYPVSDSFSVFAETRYFSARSVDLEVDGGGTLSADYDTFDINIGGAFRF